MTLSMIPQGLMTHNVMIFSIMILRIIALRKSMLL
jgi:hypothetical protein